MSCLCCVVRSKQLTQPSAAAAVSTSKSSGSQKDDSAGKEGSGSNSPRSDGEELSSPSPNPQGVRGSRVVILGGRSVAYERKKYPQRIRLILMPQRMADTPTLHDLSLNKWPAWQAVIAMNYPNFLSDWLFRSGSCHILISSILSDFRSNKI